MSSSSVPFQPPLARDAEGTLLGQTMGLVAVTAGLFAVGAYLGRDLAYQWGLPGVHRRLRLPRRQNLAAQRSDGLTVIPPGLTTANQTTLNGMPSQPELPRLSWTGLSGRLAVIP
jgi:hypothetical protein